MWIRPINNASARYEKSIYRQDEPTDVCAICGEYIWWPEEEIGWNENRRMCHAECMKEKYMNDLENLSFDPITHTYRIGETAVPSVTKLTEIYSTLEAAQETELELAIDAAAERGSVLHKYLECCMLGDSWEEDEIPAVWSGYVSSIDLFLAEHELEPLLIETPLFMTDGFQFAGTPDCIALFDGRMSILDWKFFSQVQKTKVGAQLTGYQTLCEGNGIYPESLFCVQFMPDGTYRLYPVGQGSESFSLSCRVYQEKHKKHPRGGIA